MSTALIPTATFCCVQCRLLQPPTTSCVECAAPMTAPVELVRELLSYRDMRFGSHRDWGMITAFIAGGSLAFPILAPFALTSMLAFGVYAVRKRWTRRHGIVGVELPAIVPAVGASKVYGTPRKFRSTLTSLLDDAPVLLEHAVVRDPKGGVIVRRTEATPFLLEVEDAEPMLVAGVTRVAAPNVLVRRMRVERDDPRLIRMGIPIELAISGVLEVASIHPDGVRLAVSGIPEDEVHPDIAFHRDGGRIKVMRGRVGTPVVVVDPRLVAASL